MVILAWLWLCVNYANESYPRQWNYAQWQLQLQKVQPQRQPNIIIIVAVFLFFFSLSWRQKKALAQCVSSSTNCTNKCTDTSGTWTMVNKDEDLERRSTKNLERRTRTQSSLISDRLRAGHSLKSIPWHLCQLQDPVASTLKWSKRPRPLANITATQRFVFYHVYKSQKAILHHNAAEGDVRDEMQMLMLMQLGNGNGHGDGVKVGVRAGDGDRDGGLNSFRA